MSELTQEEKLKIFEKLPKEFRELMESESTGAFLLCMGGKYNLDDDKVSALSKIVGDIILKMTPITSLAQEIANKVISDPQTAMIIAQELNNELLAPILMPTQVAPIAPTPTPVVPAMPSLAPAPMPTPVMLPVPKPVLPATPLMPQPVPAPVVPITKPAAPRSDQYREPTSGGPEIIDLRKTPPAVSKVEPPPLMQMPVAAAPIPPRPLTFTKPIEPLKPMPLIEADPHKIMPPLAPTPQPLAPKVKAQKIPSPSQISPASPPVVSPVEPQYIIRPPGMAPTDLPRDVLDLRKDKGEF